MNNVLTLRRMLTLRIELIDSDPLIWRRLEIDDSLDLVETGLALQIAMGWEHAHLQAFHSAQPYRYQRSEETITWYDRYSIDEIGLGEPQEETTLAQALKASNGELFFEYDFGDGWMHRLTVEAHRAKSDEDPRYRLLGGELRAPLEDSGGIEGWYATLEALNTVDEDDDEEAAATREWAQWRGGPWNPFDPSSCDLPVANRRLDMLANDFSGSNAVGTWMSELGEELRQYLSVILAQADIRLEPTSRPVPGWMAEVTAPYMMLAELCRDGVTLTKAEWMPQSVTTELVKRAGWEGIDYEKGASKKEHLMPTVANFRESAVKLGLLRKAKGVLSTTQRGRKLMNDPQALARHVINKLRMAQPMTVEGDSEYVEWIIRASGRTPSSSAAHYGHGDRYTHQSEVLANFGYWDPRRNEPVSSKTYFPVSRLWYVLTEILHFQALQEAGDENRAEAWKLEERRLAELSRFILEA